jgi:hypothetical protein
MSRTLNTSPTPGQEHKRSKQEVYKLVHAACRSAVRARGAVGRG